MSISSERKGRGQKDGRILKILILTVILSFLTSWAVASSTPLETVEVGTNKVLQILKAESGNKQKRRADIRTVVNEYFDFDAMARRALGPHWNEESPAKQQEFTELFSEFLFNVYIDKVEKYTNEKITYNMKEAEGNYAVVDALVTGAPSGNIAIRYSLRLKNGNWKAYDVAIEGIGLINNYRSQFDSILSRSSFDELLNQLKQKNLQER